MSPSPLRSTVPRSRPRERMSSLGPDALTDRELVALLLSSGRRGSSVLDVAQELLTTFGGVAGLATADVVALARLDGVGPAKAARIAAAFALGRRRATAHDPRPVVGSSNDIARVAAPWLEDRNRERVVAVVCDRRQRVLAVTVVAEGSAHGAAFPVREVLAEVLRRDGSAVALAHQHPGGDPTPSERDIVATRALAGAAEQCGVRFLDHVVLGGGQWRSVNARVSALRPLGG